MLSPDAAACSRSGWPPGGPRRRGAARTSAPTEGMTTSIRHAGERVMGAPPRLIDPAWRGRSTRRGARTPIGTTALAPEQCDPSAGEIGPPADVASPPRSGMRSAAGARSRARARSASRSARGSLPCPAASRARSPTSSARGSRVIPPHGRAATSPDELSWRAGRLGALCLARGWVASGTRAPSGAPADPDDWQVGALSVWNLPPPRRPLASPPSPVRRRRQAAPRSDGGAGAQLRVQRVALGDRGHALGELGPRGLERRASAPWR